MKEKIATVTRLRRQVASPLVRTSRNSRSLARSWRGVEPPPPPPPPPPDQHRGRPIRPECCVRGRRCRPLQGLHLDRAPLSCALRMVGASGAFAVGAFRPARLAGVASSRRRHEPCPRCRCTICGAGPSSGTSIGARSAASAIVSPSAGAAAEASSLSAAAMGVPGSVAAPLRGGSEERQRPAKVP